jgi:predicted ATPase
VSERTGGVPLFVEEVTRLLLERGERGGVQAIPPTLQQSLAARLDRLGSAREVAQIGAVLGRDFAYPLLHDVSELDEPALRASLDRLADADLLFVEGAPPQASYRFKHALIQDAAYDSLLKIRRQALHKRAAELLRDDPERALAEPEIVAHHFTQAGLDDLAIEWWGKAGDQALRRSAFQEAIAHLGKAIAMADKAESMTSREIGDASGQRLKLQTDYGQAVMWSKGFAAEETKAAFAREAELAADAGNFPARFAAFLGQFRVACTAGELRSARELALALLRDAEEQGGHEEATAAANAILGCTAYWMADFAEARSRCTAALAARGADWMEQGVLRTVTTSFLALTLWQVGEIERGRELIDGSTGRMAEGGHIPAILEALFYKSYFELWRDDPAATLSAAEALARVARSHGVSQYLHEAEMHLGWVQGRTGDPAAGAAQIQGVLAAFVEQGVKVNLGFYTGLLAQLEAEALGPERALARVDEAFGLANQVELRCSFPFLHRLRGNILVRHEPANPAPAEEAFKVAIAVAREQGARSPVLLASLALAKLYQSTARSVEAHAVLAPALEGFSPTPEMPEIAEAQALLAALAEADEVKAEETRRRQRLHLQSSYSRAQMMAKGFAAEETRAAIARAAELAGESGDVSERLGAIYGRIAAALTGGELLLARELVSEAQREAGKAGRIDEAESVNWLCGMVDFWRGEFAEARKCYERAVAVRDRVIPNFQEQYGDIGAQAASALASPLWQLGELDHARDLVGVAARWASEGGHGGSLADTLFWTLYFEVWRGDPAAVLSAAEALEAVAREHGMTQYVNEAELHLGWARGRIGDAAAGAMQVQRVLAAFVEQGVRINLGFYNGLLAQLEAETLGAESALARIDEAFRLSNEVGHRCSLPFLHRLRGEILLKRNPPDVPAAEEAFRTSIAIAKEQGARSPVLLASLALAKLYQSTGRLVEAHAVLAPALEGFTPTPEMPETAEAEALMERLA